MPTPSETAGLLDRAADIIASGWTQGALRRGDCYCLDGAVLAASGYAVPEAHAKLNFTQGNTPTDDAYEQLANDPTCAAAIDALCTKLEHINTESKVMQVYRFNDDIPRTQDEVITLCRTVAQELRA